MKVNKPYLDPVNMNAYIKFGEILSICSQDIERKRNSLRQPRAIALVQMFFGIFWYPRNTNTRVVTLKTYAFDYETIQSQITDSHTAPR